MVGESDISYRLHISCDNCPVEMVYILSILTAYGIITLHNIIM